MNVNLLVDGIVRQTMVLIAQLATSGGARSPLAHVANQIFMDLSQELQKSGLGRKVIADMFGLTLRAYHAKVRRLSEGSSVRGKSLWEAVVAFLEQRQTVARAEILKRFRNDDQIVLSGILNDLVETGLVFKTGEGSAALYRMVVEDDLLLTADLGAESTKALVWVQVHVQGPISADRLSESIPSLSVETLSEVLQALVEDGRVQQKEAPSVVEYFCENVLIPVGAEVGWEAAVLDHFQAVANAVAAKANSQKTKAEEQDLIGGGTFHYDLWEGHPLQEEVHALFQRVRNEASSLRKRIEAIERPENHAPDDDRRVTFYVGQFASKDEAPSPSPDADEGHTSRKKKESSKRS